MSTCPIFSRETRLGLVLYGGVSLAIYMNGVCQEFYNAVRGRGIYKLIKALTDSDIIIDIVSGTSAGGVNGVLLSYAIANSNQEHLIDFSKTANMWIEEADINKLLKHRNNKKNGKTIFSKINFPNFKKNVNSVLSGDFYQEILEEAFKEELKCAPEGEFYSDFSELDLFITATDLYGRIEKVIDNTGQIIDLKDHRTVFHLKYRQDQVDFIDNPFKFGEDTQKSLAKLCRITSCFPVAFPIVKVTLNPKDKVSPEDSKLIEWGKLGDRENQENELFFVDGGVLNNRPFTSTIQAIYGRTAYRPVDRKLFYVDPNPETFVNNKSSSDPPPLLVALESKVNIPNYQSITKDLRHINEGNRKVIRQQLLRDSLDKKWSDILESYPNFNIFDWIKKPEVVNYLKCRFLSLFDNSIDQIIQTSFRHSGTKEHLLTQISNFFNKRNGDLESKNCQDIYQEILPWDIEFMIRKHSFLLEILAKRIQDFQNSQDSKNSQGHQIKHYLVSRYLAYQLSWQLELLKIIQKAIYSVLKGYDYEIKEDDNQSQEECSKESEQLQSVYTFLVNVYKTMLRIDDKNKELLESYYELVKINHFPDDIEFDSVRWSDLKILIPEQESSQRKKEIFAKIYEMPVCQVLLKKNGEKQKYINDELKPKIKHNMECQSDPNILDLERSLLKIIDDHSMMMIKNASKHCEELCLKEFSERYELIDMSLYPYGYLSDVVTKNTIEVVRISPTDDQDPAKGLGYGKGKKIDQKLRGYTWNAFGGFLNQDWRRNDTLWGRLDGASRIIQALVTPTSINNFRESLKKYPKDKWEDLIPEGENPDSEDRKKVIEALKEFIQDENYFSADLHTKEGKFEQFLDSLVKLGQAPIKAELEKIPGKLDSKKSLSPCQWTRMVWMLFRTIVSREMLWFSLSFAILGAFFGYFSNFIPNERVGDTIIGFAGGFTIGVIIYLIVSFFQQKPPANRKESQNIASG